jgi:AcrR family transcriptional regulator
MSTLNASGRSTREQILRTAERLFGERGFDGVSLREIGEAAGQRNNAVAHYYFGDKEGLIAAIMADRAGEIEDRRLAMVAAAEQLSDEAAVRALAEAIVRPQAEQWEGGHYIAFLARLQADPVRSKRVIAANPAIMRSQLAIGRALRSRLKHLPARVVRNRFALATTLAIQAVALRRVGADAEELSVLPWDQFLDDLVDALTGLLAAPTSTTTT